MSAMTQQIAGIEEAQAALRDSIEQTKQLAGNAKVLLQKHKKTLEADEPAA
jgi:hypothetical protein